MATVLRHLANHKACINPLLLLSSKWGNYQSYRKFHLCRSLHRIDRRIPLLTPNEVTTILKKNEEKIELPENGPIKYYECNQLPSNNPTEDVLIEAKCNFTSGMLFGVFDGHAGTACARALKQRLFDYISVSLMRPEVLEAVSHRIKDNLYTNLVSHYRQFLNGNTRDYMLEMYAKSLAKFVEESMSTIMWDDFSMAEALQSGFVRMDQDMSTEALRNSGSSHIFYDTIEIVLSGACACIAHIDGLHLHVANTGDCRALLGQIDNEGQWVAKNLSTEHNTDNREEVLRIKSEHPADEQSSVIQNNRLLGQLAPLRAFGDVRYKWDLRDLMKAINILSKSGSSVIQQSHLPPKYYTPPYLTAKPDVTHHKLTARDKFLILATDGLWDMMSSQKAVTLVGEHMQGKQTLNTFSLPNPSMTLGELNQNLSDRQRWLAHKPIDDNVTTHLIRNALGASTSGISHLKLMTLLGIPPPFSRHYRDDISITVIHFDTDYLTERAADS